LIYTFDSRIRLSETDEDGILKYESFIDYFQDCSTFQSEDLGVGTDYLKVNNLAWVLNSWQIELYRYPKIGEHVTTGTFAYDFKSFMGYRNFFMTDSDGEYLAKAASIWVLLNMETGKPQKADPEQIARYGCEPRLEMDYGSRKIAVPDGLKKYDDIVINRTHLDTNHHVNNAQFVKIAAGYITENIRPERIRVEYKKQAFLNDVVVPYSDGAIVDLRTVEGNTFCIVETV